jgi:hypothetical protein
MTTHKCSKEREINEVAIGLATVNNDIKWTKDNIKHISDKLDIILKEFNVLNVQLSRMSKDMYGNGVEGLKTKVSQHNEYITTQKGSLNTMYIVFGIVQSIMVGVIVWAITNGKF